jgi:predicted nucleic acid-binding Zn ribbon protein
MTTYVYETIPSQENESPKIFEIQQSMKDAPLTVHPETGESIRRVVLGGYGLMKQESANSKNDCGPSCCCH